MGRIRSVAPFLFAPYFTLGLGFFNTLIQAWSLTPAQLGSVQPFILLITFFQYLSMLGMDQAYLRHYHEVSEQDRWIFFYECLTVPLGLLFFMGSAGYLLRSYVIELFGITKSLIALSPSLYFILILASASSLFNSFCNFTFRLREQGTRFFLTQALVPILNITGVLGGFYLYGPAPLVVIIANASSIIMVAVISIFAIGLPPKKAKRGFSLARIYSNLKYALPLYPGQIMAWTNQSMDKLLIMNFLGPSETGLYLTSQRIILTLQPLQTGFSNIWWPYVFKKWEENKSACIQSIGVIIDYTIALIFPLAALFISISDLLLKILPPNYYQARNIIPYLLMNFIITILHMIIPIGIELMKKTAYIFAVHSTMLLLNYTSMIGLILLFRAPGVALSCALSNLAGLALAVHFSKKLLPISFSEGKTLLSFVILFTNSVAVGVSDYSLWSRIVCVITALFLFFMYRREFLQIKSNYLKFQKTTN